MLGVSIGMDNVWRMIIKKIEPTSHLQAPGDAAEGVSDGYTAVLLETLTSIQCG